MNNLIDKIPNVLLMGPGPSPVAPSTYHALSRNTLGHLDVSFLEIMDAIKLQLQTLMGTKNRLTVPVSGTGSSGMEAAFVNIVEPGDKVLILINGVFGMRMADVAGRLHADVTELNFEWGTPVVPEAVAEQLKKDDYKLVAVVHAETSTGVESPIEEIGKLVKETGALYLVDAVTSLGGMPVEVDKCGIDICYSGSQKCISCPPGLAPITFSEKACEKFSNRSTKVPNWALDMNMITKYWEGATRVYHHTAPVNMLYGLYQAIFNILEEGTDKVFARHAETSAELIKGLDEIGWKMLVDKEYRLPMVNSVVVPEGVDEKLLRKRLLKEHGIEVGSGLGDLAGKIIRIGIMGYGAKSENVERLLAAMKDVM